MAVAPERASPLAAIFGVEKPLIGSIHCAPLPGTPRYRGETMTAVVRRAVEDASSYPEGGWTAC